MVYGALPCRGGLFARTVTRSLKPPLQDFVQFNKPSFKKQCKGTFFLSLLQSRFFGKLYP